jgi:predicted DNA-binding protein YlxM (UPF0122 family)
MFGKHFLPLASCQEFLEDIAKSIIFSDKTIREVAEKYNISKSSLSKNFKKIKNKNLKKQLMKKFLCRRGVI